MRKSIYSPMSRRLAALLRERREAAGLTTTDAGSALGTSHTYVVDYEAGQRRLDLAQLQRVAWVLGTTLVAIVEELIAIPASGEPSAAKSVPQEFVPMPAPEGVDREARVLTEVWYREERRRWARFLRAARKRQRTPDGRELPQTELAERMGVTQSFVSKYESKHERNRRRIDLPELEQIAAGLETSLLALVEEFEATWAQRDCPEPSAWADQGDCP